MTRLSYAQIEELFAGCATESVISFERVRPHNKSEIRRQVTLALDDLLNEIRISMEEGHLHGGDMEVRLDALSLKLVGHHDGIFWTEPLQSDQANASDTAE